jgi:pteridine reductase
VAAEQQPLSGQLALITGAGQRVGRAIAETLADAGADLVLHYHSSGPDAERLAESVMPRVQAQTIAADLSDPAAVEALVQRAADLGGRPLTLLVNNASAYDERRLRDLTYADLDRAMRLSAWAPFGLIRSFAAQTEDGAVINLLDSRIADYDWLHVGYILAKKTLAELTAMAAIEYAPGIRVNAVAAGVILPPAGSGQAYFDRVKNTMPLKRIGDPKDVAEAVLYLATASYVTGQVIYVDGGRHLGRTINT